MQVIEQAVQAARAQGKVNGAELAATLEAIAACGDQAAQLWKAYLDKPGAPGDKYSIVTWIGPERAKQLYELSLKAHELMRGVRAAAGTQARFLVLEESPVVLAYRGLKEGETGPQAAQAALTAQQEIIAQIRALAGQVRSLKTGGASKQDKKPAAKKSAKTSSKKKTASTKKSATKTKKPTKKAAVKKSPKKK